MAACVPRVAAQDAPGTKVNALERAMLEDGLAGVL